MISTRNSSRRIALQRIANSAHELELNVMQGRLSKSAETGRWQIGSQDLSSWLEAHVGEDVVALMGSMEDTISADAGDTAHDLHPRTCRKCGRDFADVECPHCRHNRRRIRGRY